MKKITKSLAIKSFAFLFILTLFSTFASAQVTYHKIKDGVKTVLPEGENAKLKLSDDSKADGNLVIEVNVKEFRKKYKYDNILVVLYGLGTRTTPLVSHTFEDEYIKKKYADVNILNFYAFNNTDYKNELGNYATTLSTFFIPEIKQTYQYRIIGRYKTGTEKYWDENSNSYKMRNIFDDGDFIRSVEISFEENSNVTLSRNYANYIDRDHLDEYNGTPTLSFATKNLKYCARKLDELKVGFGPVTKQKYKNIANAMNDIAEAKNKEIKGEKDKGKALDMFYAWQKESANYCIVDSKDKAEKLKLLEKELGSASTIEQKLDLLRGYVKK